MGWFARYNDARAVSRGPKSIGRRAAYRGAMAIYSARPRASRQRTPGETQALAVAILVVLGLAILLLVWLV